MNNNIKITDIEEHEDGSATVKLDLDPDTYAAIFNVGFIHLIRKGIDNDPDTGRREHNDNT